MARDTYIIRPKALPRTAPKPVSREDRIAAVAHQVLGNVARNLDQRQYLKPRKPFGR